MFFCTHWLQPWLTAPFPSFFFFNDTATTEIYTLSLHDALPIYAPPVQHGQLDHHLPRARARRLAPVDRKSTRLNSSHLVISYAVFCLKKKKIHHLPRALEPIYTTPSRLRPANTVHPLHAHSASL